MSSSAARALPLAASLAFCALTSFGSAQTAVLLDGRILTPKNPPSIFATEGPIWNLDLQNQGIVVTGKKVTIPHLLNGQPFQISGSSVLGQDGEAATGIGAADFTRLVDTNAIGSDRDFASVDANLGPRRLGPARSLFSTTEARRATDNADFVRDPAAQSAIEQNYFQILQQCHAVHAANLPADFLDRAGLRGTDPANWAYPVTAGGTLKSAGQVYVDSLGREYFVPDTEVVIELSENVASGVVRSAVRGSGSRPDSFVMGDLLVVFNQDPRFGADVLGLGEAVIPRHVLFDALVPGETVVDVIGHMVGEHVLFAQEVLTEFVDPAAGIHITADRFVVKVASRELRWRGTVDKPQGIRLVGVLIDTRAGGLQTRREFPVAMAIDPLTGGATYDARLRNIDLTFTTHIEMQARDAVTGAVEASELFDIRPFRQ